MFRRRPRSEELSLGTITLPSGLLVIADMGYLDMWSGEDQPTRPDVDDPALQARIAAAQDLRVTGPDAEAAARAFDRQSLTYLYDIPDADAFARLFREVVGPAQLDAEIEAEPRRIPHAERARRAADAGGADFLVNGVWMTAIAGFPADTPLQVVGREVDYGGSVGPRWETLVVELSPSPASATRRIGFVGVDWARLIFADVACLNAWVHDEPLDGRADLAFWGADEQACRTAFGGARLEEGVLGWENLPVQEAVDRGLAIEEWRATNQRRVVVDFRPHSHHHRVMRDVRRHPHGVGQLDLAGGRVFAMMTSWGDGIFPVEADHAADGSLLRVRVVLGDDERRERTEDLARRA